MQTAETIVAVNRDPDAPIAEFADLVVDRRPVRGRPGAPRRACARAPAERRTGTGQPRGHDGATARSCRCWRSSSWPSCSCSSCAGPAGSLQRPATSIGSDARSADLTTRIETSLGEVAARVDGLRRGQLGAEALGDDLTASIDAVERYARRGAGPPRSGRRDAPIRDEIVAELERAGRALEMIEHGRSIQASARSGGREVEAQTSIKRGYLNVLHAREAIAQQAVLARRRPRGRAGRVRAPQRVTGARRRDSAPGSTGGDPCIRCPARSARSCSTWTGC